MVALPVTTGLLGVGLLDVGLLDVGLLGVGLLGAASLLVTVTAGLLPPPPQATSWAAINREMSTFVKRDRISCRMVIRCSPEIPGTCCPSGA